VTFLLNRPIARLRATSTQSIADSTPTAITFDAEDVDTYGGHSTSVNPSRYTGQVAGWYWAAAKAFFGANSTGIRRISLYVNGAEYSQVDVPPPSSGAATMSIIELVYLNVGDYVEAWVEQTTGSALLLSPGSGALGSTLNVTWEHA
jgi:hypothetical protein